MVTTDPEPITVSVSTPIPVEMLPHTGVDTFITIGAAIILITIGAALQRKAYKMMKGQ